jgi:arsenate reductase
MAEGLLRHLAGDRFDVFSAGTEQTRVHPLAIEAMKDSGSTSRRIPRRPSRGFLTQKLDYVITVCDRANESCPIFPGDTKRIHWGFDDPSAETGTDAERLTAFRRIRDEIAARLRIFLSLAEHR